jgi:hypothetical protein
MDKRDRPIWVYGENEAIEIDHSIQFTASNTFYTDVEKLSDTLGLAIHPCLKQEKQLPELPLQLDNIEKEESKSPHSPQDSRTHDPTGGAGSPSEALKAGEKQEPKELSIFTKRLDRNSIHILLTILPHSEITTLKLGNNGFTSDNYKMLVSGLPNTKITQMFFDWNPISDNSPLHYEEDPEEKDKISDSPYTRLIDNPHLEFLYLRSNAIDDNAVYAIASAIIGNSTLRCLDLSRNRITKAGVDKLAEALDSNRTLEYLGLACNDLVKEDVLGFLQVFGKNPFPGELVEEHLKKVKERDQIIDKNKKAKGKSEVPVPKVDAIEQVSDSEEWVVLKNLEFKHLNLALNKFDDTIASFASELLTKMPSSFSLTISNKSYSRDLVKSLNNKFPDRIAMF